MGGWESRPTFSVSPCNARACRVIADAEAEVAELAKEAARADAAARAAKRAETSNAQMKKDMLQLKVGVFCWFFLFFLGGVLLDAAVAQWTCVLWYSCKQGEGRGRGVNMCVSISHADPSLTH